MNAVQYVNLHGDRVSIARLSAMARPPAKRKRPAESESDRKFMGYVVTGYPPELVEEVKAKHAQKQADARKKSRSRPPEPFDLDAALNRERPKRARAKPYELHQAAVECAELMRRAGWLRVTVEEIKK